MPWNEDKWNLGPGDEKTIRDVRDILVKHRDLDGRFNTQIKIGLLRRLVDIIESVSPPLPERTKR